MFASILILLTGCNDVLVGVEEEACPPGFVEGAEGCEFDELAVVEVLRSFDDGSLVRINAVPFVQTMGPNLLRNVWVSPVPINNAVLSAGPQMDAADLYMEVDPYDHEAILSAEFPIGTLIVHETVNREEGHTVQVKLGADHADENGRDWWFGKYYDDGTPDTNDCSPCTTCHTSDARPNSDGLWGVPREAL